MSDIFKKIRSFFAKVGKALKRAAIVTGNYLKTRPGIAVALLLVLTVISAIVLSFKLYNIVNIDEREVLLSSDLNKKLDLFSVYYENDSGEITVCGSDVDGKVIAPGTKVEYTIRLRNKDKIAIDYLLIPDLSYTSEHSVPILFRMIDGDGNYIIGDAKTWATIEDIGEISEQRTLCKNESAEYIFEWKWEFESGDDEYDTIIGTLAKEENVGVSVKFDLLAEANTSVEDTCGLISSGILEMIVIGLAIAVLGTAITLLIITAVKEKKGSSKENEL